MGTITTERSAQSGLSERLVRACQDGNVEAQRDLYECYETKVYSLAVYLTGDAETAKDLTQEIFLKVFRDLRAFRFESSFSSWSHRMALSQWLKRYPELKDRKRAGVAEAFEEIKKRERK